MWKFLLWAHHWRLLSYLSHLSWLEGFKLHVVMLELDLLRTGIERCLSWLFSCIPSSVPCWLGSHPPQSKAGVALIELDGFHAWTWGLSIFWGSPGNSLAKRYLGFFTPSSLVFVSLCSLKVMQLLSHNLTDKPYRDVWGWVQHHTNLCCFWCKLLYLRNTAQCCVNSLAWVSATVEIFSSVHLLRFVNEYL